MRLKSFTLIEVMIASYIFMVVILMVVASFAMVRKSNESSDDSRVTSNCSRQVEDIFRSAVKSANFGKPLIKGITFGVSSGVSKYTLVSTSTSGLVGFATFEDPQVSDISKVKIKTFVKKPETIGSSTLSSYYYATGVVSLSTPGADPRKDIPDGFDVSSIVNLADAQRINSADCSALILPGEILVKSAAGFGARSTVSVYSLSVKDKFFRAFADQSSEKRYSDVNIFVSNDAKTF